MTSVRTSSDALLNIINDILDYTKIEVGKMKLEKIVFNLRRVINDVVSLFQLSAVGKGLKMGVDPNGKVKLSFVVKDTGVGIPEEKRDILFKSFSQVDNSNTRQYGGSGLGLVIAKSLLELMEGEISVESKEGQGSSFYFTCILGIVAVQKDFLEVATKK